MKKKKDDVVVANVIVNGEAFEAEVDFGEKLEQPTFPIAEEAKPIIDKSTIIADIKAIREKKRQARSTFIDEKKLIVKERELKEKIEAEISKELDARYAELLESTSQELAKQRIYGQVSAKVEATAREVLERVKKEESEEAFAELGAETIEAIKVEIADDVMSKLKEEYTEQLAERFQSAING